MGHPDTKFMDDSNKFGYQCCEPIRLFDFEVLPVLLLRKKQNALTNLEMNSKGQIPKSKSFPFKLLHYVAGWTDVPLNDIGLKQARAAGNALKSVTFHQAYSSDLSRANMTCQIILEENQASSITVKNIKKDKRLRDHS